MPEMIFDSVDAIPEAARSLFTEKEGKFVANLVPKAELDTFRDNNINISKERDTLKSTIGRLTTDVGFDPEKFDEWIEGVKTNAQIKQQVDDGKLVADSSLEAAVEAKTGEMKRSYEAKINGLETNNRQLATDNETLKRNIDRNAVEQEVLQAINAEDSGALPSATKHILREAHGVFSMKDGELTPMDSKGNILYGADGASKLSPKEWLKSLQETDPFFFKPSEGGGAGGGGGGGGGLTPAQLAAMSPEEKMNYGRRHNQNR